MEVVGTFQDIPPYELEIEVTTSESPLSLQNFNPNPFTSNISSSNPEQLSSANNSSVSSVVNPSSQSSSTGEAEVSAEKISSNRFPCSSSADQPTGNPPTPLSLSDSTGVTAPNCSEPSGGGIPVSTIQWAPGRKSKSTGNFVGEQTNKNDSPVNGIKLSAAIPQAASNSVKAKNDTKAASDDDDDVVYVGEYRPLNKSVVPLESQVCPYCSCSCRGGFNNRLKSKMSSAISHENFVRNPRFNPMRRGISHHPQGEMSMIARQYFQPYQEMSLLATRSSNGNEPRVPSLFPEPPENEWPHVRVFHIEPKRLGINIRSYDIRTKKQP